MLIKVLEEYVNHAGKLNVYITLKLVYEIPAFEALISNLANIAIFKSNEQGSAKVNIVSVNKCLSTPDVVRFLKIKI